MLWYRIPYKAELDTPIRTAFHNILVDNSSRHVGVALYWRLQIDGNSHFFFAVAEDSKHFVVPLILEFGARRCSAPRRGSVVYLDGDGDVLS